MKQKSHRHHAFLTFAITVLAAGVLLPLVRVQPESVHKYLNGLNDWIRIIFAFSLCTVFTGAMFKLLSPRLRQLAHWWHLPPSWLAVLIGWFVVAVIDLQGGFDTDGYRANLLEWLAYGGGSVLLVGLCSGWWSEITSLFPKQSNQQADATKCITFQEVAAAPWEEIEAWLKSDEPAQYDFLGNQSVAQRVSFIASEGIRSVGIVGPYGAGKTSIVNWISNRLKKHEIGGRKFFVCHHSCWGFETSASAIHDMLGSAVSILSAEIDTFQLDSLPESYRKTFSAGGDWVETVSNLILHTHNPMEQFSRLSDLLGRIGGRLVFVVEDLDRNETRNFEIQDVLAFLERLKEHSNISFILTGGLSSSQHIDYTKLCDHIEYLQSIQPQHSSGLIKLVSQRCQDDTFFPHVRLGDGSEVHHWEVLTGILMRDYKELSLPQAVASLLNTPRSLRHALGRTFSAWHVLKGEIDFNHLLAVNILRFGAPECFQFLLRRWDRIHALPNRSPSFGQTRIDGIRQAITDDWNRTIQNVEWNPTAALQVMKFILPAIEYWLVDESGKGQIQGGRQFVSEERYWVRAVNESIGGDDVRDQEIIRDVQAWLENPSMMAELVTKLTTLPRYADIWENLVGRLSHIQHDKILLLCEQVINRIIYESGSSATGDSQGFIHTWRFALHWAGNQESNSTWLQTRISEAVKISLKMAIDIWYYYGSPRQNFIRSKDMQEIRQHMLDAVKKYVPDTESLIARLSSSTSSTLYQLVFDPGQEEPRYLADLQSWMWLSPMILDGARRRDLAVTANLGVLLGARVSGRERMDIDTEVLDKFFDGDALEVINILESMISQLPEADQSLVRNVVGAARRNQIVDTSPFQQGG